MGVYLVIDNLGGGGDTERRLAAKRVVLKCWECYISIATYLRGHLPSYQVVLQCIWNWHATFKSLRTDTHTQTDNLSTTDSRLYMLHDDAESVDMNVVWVFI